MEGSGGLFAFVALFVSAANTVWTWVSKGQTATRDKVSAVEAKVDTVQATLVSRFDLVEDRVLKLERDFQHMPNKEDFTGLRVQLAEVMATMRSSENEQASIRRIVNRIDDFLREKA